MAHPVFISFARGASKAHAQALKSKLGDLAFLDLDDIDDGEQFPPRLLNGLLNAHVVVVFATRLYSERRFCRLELRIALAAGESSASHIVVALGEEPGTILDGLPASVATASWPQAEEASRLEALVRKRLSSKTSQLRETLSETDAQRIAVAFLDRSNIPEPQSLHEIVVSLPPGVAFQSIGSRFVGRFDDLRRIHDILSEGSGGKAQLTSRIAAGAGFGKTRLAAEYLHRYAQHYPGGLFWINAASVSLDEEFWRVLHSLDPQVPALAEMRKVGRDVRAEFEAALRQIEKPALCVVDNIPEAAPGSQPLSIADFCPALGAVSILATSRQDPHEPGVATILIDELKPNAAVLLLTEGVPSSGKVSWAEWERIATWVGNLPIALDLLNRSLALGSLFINDLLQSVNSSSESPSATAELDRLSEALREQVPAGAVRGITEALLVSFEKLSDAAKHTAKILAHLAPAPIPEAFMDALPEEQKTPAVRAALRSRHFLTPAGDNSFGVMHRLMADFLRTLAGNDSSALVEAACLSVLEVMKPNACRDPRQWPLMNLFLPHAEFLLERVTADPDQISLTNIGLLAAILASAQGDYSAARRMEERVLDARTRALGKDHSDTLTSMNNLASTLSDQGDLAGARRLQEQVLDARTRVFGEEHSDTLTSMNNLALTLLDQGDLAGARRLQEQVLDACTRMLGKEHPSTLTSMNNLAQSLRAQCDLAGARRLQEQVLEARTRILGKEHPDTLTSMNNLASTLGEQGDLAGARRLQEQVLEARTRMLGKEHPSTLTSMNNLGFILLEFGEREAALSLLRECLALRRKVLGVKHPDTIASQKYLEQLGDNP